MLQRSVTFGLNAKLYALYPERFKTNLGVQNDFVKIPCLKSLANVANFGDNGDDLLFT